MIFSFRHAWPAFNKIAESMKRGNRHVGVKMTTYTDAEITAILKEKARKVKLHNIVSDMTPL